MKRPLRLSPRLLTHLLLLRPFVGLFFGVNAAGRENLEGLDRYILVANHNSHLDTALLFHVLPLRDIPATRPVAAKEYFSRSRLVFRLVDWLFRPVWVERGSLDRDPLRGMREALRAGHNLILYPEGTRGTPGEMAAFRQGVGKLAEEHPDIPVVPVHLAGPERSLPKGGPVPLPIWNNVVIGPPRTIAGGAREFVRSLEETIRELSRSEAAHRHRRARRAERPPAVAVLGIDGSGKSTLSRNLTRALSMRRRVCLVSDGLELWEEGERQGLQPLLAEKVREVVGAYAKKAGSLKRYKLPKLGELLLRDHLMGQVRRWYAPGLIVQDGCPALNLTAWAMLYREEGLDAEVCSKALRVLTGRGGPVDRDDPIYTRHPELAALERLGLTTLGLPEAVVFLDVDPALSIERIHGRGQRVQVHETGEKLARLRRGYLAVCEAIGREFEVPVRTLDGALGPEEATAAALEFVRESIPGRSCDG